MTGTLKTVDEMVCFRDSLDKKLQEAISCGKTDWASKLKETSQQLDALIEEEKIAVDFWFFYRTLTRNSTPKNGMLECKIRIDGKSEEMETFRRIVVALNALIRSPGGKSKLRRIVDGRMSKQFARREWKEVISIIKGLATC
jgi:hypothetical protein